jgi:Methyltransferase domain
MAGAKLHHQIPIFGRPFLQRNEARSQRDQARLERNEARTELYDARRELENTRQERDDARRELENICQERDDARKEASDAALTRLCVFCNRSVEAWMPYRIREADLSIFLKKVQLVGSNLDRCWCPCGESFDRERHLRLFLDRLNIMERVRGGTVLHMAPEHWLRRYIESYDLVTYVIGDLAPSSAEVQQIDLQQIPYPDETFDMVICNHILEHVDNADIALREIHRVLKRGGRAICQTPYASRLTKTFEDPLLQSTDDRLLFYAQEDHVRLFGSDIAQHFIAAGFIGRLVPHSEILPDVDPEQFGVNEKEPFFDFVRA